LATNRIGNRGTFSLSAGCDIVAGVINQFQRVEEPCKRNELLNLLLQHVKEFWVDGVLKGREQHATLLELEMQLEDGVNPWGASEPLIELPDGSRQVLAPDKTSP
jgi:hypothetical protein